MFNALQQHALEPKHPLAGLNLVGTNKLKRKKKKHAKKHQKYQHSHPPLAWHMEKTACRLQYDQYRLRAMKSKRPCINYSLKRIYDHMAERHG